MGFEYVSKLPTPDEIKEQFPLAPELARATPATLLDWAQRHWRLERVPARAQRPWDGIRHGESTPVD